MIEALVYDIEVTTDIVHGWTNTIKEIYIPNMGFYINKENCFFEKGSSRLDMAQNKKPIEIDNDLVLRLYRSTEEYKDAESKMKTQRGRFVDTYLGEKS